MPEQNDENKNLSMTDTHVGAHASGFSYKGDTEDEFPDALESLEPHLEPSLINDDTDVVLEDESIGRHGKGASAKTSGSSVSSKEIPPYMRKSRRMRKILIVVIILLLLLIAALVYFSTQLVQESQLVATQQAQKQSESDADTSALQDSEAKDVVDQAEKTTAAPDLYSLIGLTQDEAIEELEHGATASAAREVNEEGNPIKSTVNVTLTSEPADTKSGTPTVYLGFDEAGLIIQAGYSASTSSLGFGTLSFSDAVKNEGVVEKTLQEAGIDVEEGTVELPSDKSEYSTYASDATTLVKENCSFSGDVTIDGVAYTWSAVLSYDYSAANASGNLNDTIRTIYVYINA